MKIDIENLGNGNKEQEHLAGDRGIFLNTELRYACYRTSRALNKDD